MAGVFYSRYVPPAQPSTLSDPSASKTTPPRKKRKRDKVEINTRQTNSHSHTLDKPTRPKSPQAEREASNEKSLLSKHAKISFKYDQDRQAQAKLRADTQDDHLNRPDTQPPIEEVHGLEPIPQPPSRLESIEPPNFSTLPTWLSNPVEIRDNQSCPFEELGIDHNILSNLRVSHLVNALPVQRSIIPLLLQGDYHNSGDLCVSAPTGSGKTLAYALPMISALVHKATTQLRGLIVVPTRELVTQVFKVYEMCASGTNLKLAAATGSKPIKEEQALIIERTKKLDPDAYREIYTKPLTPSDWESFGLEDLIEDMENAEDDIPGYVPFYKSKIDVLICTPGRLVDHIRLTKGFSLENVDMFVIDEGDKLLNDTFQDWVEVVLPALRNRSPTSLAEQILSDMGMEAPPRKVQKIILSATMTKDISKWNLLQLHNPKLLVAGEATARKDHTENSNLSAETQPEHGLFYVPQTLTEVAVPVGDGMQKPLFLLQILQGDIKPTLIDKNLYGINASKVIDDQTENISSSLDTSSSRDSMSETSDSDSSSSVSSSSPAFKFSNQNNQNKTPLSGTVLIFTRSSETALRLRRLLILLEPHYERLIAIITRSSHSASSRDAIRLFQRNKISILIATDRASRGLDLPDLGHVISYDMPPSVTAYIHRVGRTARAGKIGKAWTLVAHREGRWFWKEIGKGLQIKRPGQVGKINIYLPTGTKLEERYEQALRQLEKDVQSQGK